MKIINIISAIFMAAILAGGACFTAPALAQGYYNHHYWNGHPYYHGHYPRPPVVVGPPAVVIAPPAYYPPPPVYYPPPPPVVVAPAPVPPGINLIIPFNFR